MPRIARDETPHTVVYTVRVLNAPIEMCFATRVERFTNSAAALDRKDRLIRESESDKIEQLYYAAVIRDSDGYSISSSTHTPRANYAEVA